MLANYIFLYYIKLLIGNIYQHPTAFLQIVQLYLQVYFNTFCYFTCFWFLGPHFCILCKDYLKKIYLFFTVPFIVPTFYYFSNIKSIKFLLVPEVCRRWKSELASHHQMSTLITMHLVFFLVQAYQHIYNERTVK